MRDYFITKWELWFHVFRKIHGDDSSVREYLQKDTYTLNKSFARVFYHLNDAVSALIIARRKWDDIKGTSEETSESIQEKSIEKQSWSEFW
jgi:hypothetical protein